MSHLASFLLWDTLKNNNAMFSEFAAPVSMSLAAHIAIAQH